MTFWNSALSWLDPDGPTPPVKVSVRTFAEAIEDSLIDTYTKRQLPIVLTAELGLEPRHTDEPDTAWTKREIIQNHMHGWNLEQVVALARRLEADIEVPQIRRDRLRQLLDAYAAQEGGVGAPAKNLIFAANGPKPEIVLRDAVNNDIEIVKNAEFCLVYDRPVPPEGLWFGHLIEWWRVRQNTPDSLSDADVGRHLHNRLMASLDSNAERVVLETYAKRYREHGFDIPALVPQVYLHYDPYTQVVRKAQPNGSPLPRQRMDFLLLFSERKRVVIEIDGKQHYAEGDKASPRRYSEMMAADRRLRLAGYEVYRFGGYELTTDLAAAQKMLHAFFDELANRMK